MAQSGTPLTLTSADIDERAARVDLQVWSGAAVALLRSLPTSVPRFSRAFSYRGHSTWEMAEAALHWDILEDILPRIKAVDDVLREHQASLVVFSDDGSTSAQCILAVCNARKIPCHPRIPASVMVRKGAQGVLSKAKLLASSLIHHHLLPSRGTPPAPASHADVILLSFGSVHGPTLEPLFNRLTSSGISCQVVDFYRPLDSGGRKALEAKRIPFTDLWNYVTPEAIGRVHAFQKELARAWPLLCEDAEVNSAFSYRGVPLFPLIDSWMEHLVFSRKRFAEIAFFIEAAEEVRRRHSPSVFVSVDDISALGRAFAEVAGRHGIKSVCIQHGEMRVCPLFAPLHSTRMAVWGPFYKDEFVRMGVLAQALVVTGVPRWDDVVRRIAKNEFRPADVRARLRLPRNKKLLLWAGQKFMDNRDEVSAAVFSAGRELSKKGVVLLIKPHPEESSLGYRLNSARSGCPAHVMTGDVYSLLAACDAVVTGTSTVALDALLFGKPVVSVNLSGKPDKLTWVAEGVALGVYRGEDVLPGIEGVLFDGKTIRSLQKAGGAFLRRHADGMDGKAVERQVQLIRHLLA